MASQMQPYSIRLILYVFFYYVLNYAFNIQLIYKIQRVIRLILYVFFYYVFNYAFNIQLICKIQRLIQYSTFGEGLRVLSSCCTGYYHITESLNEAPSI